ncbi:hypothetical protein OSB04_005390 [Centaurea solstitialis]|uniref:SAC domain-containing protein n=1 Tax=Centaurea solstitialis TaxID=347529 RepID=A0AA38TSK3_9ASTR|nr:hypothetical protein OSB04_005390 [Centaurea solstitialis]
MKNPKFLKKPNQTTTTTGRKQSGRSPKQSAMAKSTKIHPTTDPEMDPSSYSLEKFKLYETRARFYLIGSDRKKRFFRVLKIDRMEPSDLNISEDPVVYPPQEVKSLLQRIAEGNRATGGLSFVAKVYGIAGCIKFLESYYLILVTKRRQIGCICGHAIYSIEESQIITIPHVSVQTDVAHSKTELRYKKLLSSVDLTKDFYYSYTYPIMRSLQKNVLSAGNEGMPYDDIFVWNAFLTQPIRSRCKNTIWTIALVHGNFKQIRLSVFGRDFSVALLSKRSRHFAGTRYLKRGVNDRGRVANDVETEQIVLDEESGSCQGKMSSVVQMRGSIPLFWSQEASRFSPKPDIILQRYDPTYEATKLHFEDLEKRYNNPIIVLNLIKTVEKRPREMMLRREFTNAVGYLNQILPEENQLRFIHWDFHKFAKSKSANVLGVLGGVASEALDLTGFYYSGKAAVIKKKSIQLSRTSTAREASLKDLRTASGDLSTLTGNTDMSSHLMKQDRDLNHGQKIKKYNHSNKDPQFQNGVLRTNCIDCLDRTNVAQYAYGLAALGRQLHAMGLTDDPKVDADSSIAAALMDMYQSMGDALAQQYGGSAAHNTVFPERQGKWKATTQSREFLKSIKRYYSNAYTDDFWATSSHRKENQHFGNLILIIIFTSPTDAEPVGVGRPLTPVAACKEDFSRIKLTSFSKLIERTSGAIKNVRLCSEPDHKPGNSGMAPDAVEIQLRSPNWLFGHKKFEESNTIPKVAADELAIKGREDEKKFDDLCDPNWISSAIDTNEEDVFRRYLAMTSIDEANGWYGGTLLAEQDENSEVYRHYAQFCQSPVMEPFQNDSDKETHYGEVLRSVAVESMDDGSVEAEMEAAVMEYKLIGADLGICPKTFNALAVDPTHLTRWMIGERQVAAA